MKAGKYNTTQHDEKSRKIYTTKYQRTFNTWKNTTYITKARSARGKIQHKILERIPYMENITQNIKVRSTRRKIQHIIFSFSFFGLFLQHKYNTNTTQTKKI